MFGLTEYPTFPFLLRESVFLLRQGTDDAGQSHWRSTNTGHNVRRFTRAAMLMVSIVSRRRPNYIRVSWTESIFFEIQKLLKSSHTVVTNNSMVLVLLLSTSTRSKEKLNTALTNVCIQETHRTFN